MYQYVSKNKSKIYSSLNVNIINLISIPIQNKAKNEERLEQEPKRRQEASKRNKNKQLAEGCWGTYLIKIK